MSRRHKGPFYCRAAANGGCNRGESATGCSFLLPSFPQIWPPTGPPSKVKADRLVAPRQTPLASRVWNLLSKALYSGSLSSSVSACTWRKRRGAQSRREHRGLCARPVGCVTRAAACAPAAGGPPTPRSVDTGRTAVFASSVCWSESRGESTAYQQIFFSVCRGRGAWRLGVPGHPMSGAGPAHGAASGGAGPGSAASPSQLKQGPVEPLHSSPRHARAGQPTSGSPSS